MHFLLRTLVIGLMVVALTLLVQDGRLFNAFSLRRSSPTVFCPTDPTEIEPLRSSFPPGQTECVPCPPNGYCTNGQMTCTATDTYFREGDKCVLNNEAHRGAHAIKESAIAILERRLGDYECGYLPSGEKPSMSVVDLKAHVFNDTASLVPYGSFEMWWVEGNHMLLRESGEKKEQPGVRVLAWQPASKRDPLRFLAIRPQLSIVCQLTRLVTEWVYHIIGISLALSLGSQLTTRLQLLVNVVHYSRC